MAQPEVLVTGAGGFIGSHLVEALVTSGTSVRAMVRYNSRNDWGQLQQIDADMLAQVEVYPGDLKDQRAVNEAVKGVSVVYNLGALIAIPYSYRHPGDVVQANIIGTYHVLEACREHRVSKLVQMSTSEVYGTARYVPIDEEHPQTAQSPYAATKIAGDKLAESYHLSYELPVAIARPFNTYGPRQSARAVIPTIITQALTRDEVRIGDRRPTRDFCFVKDTVSGLICIAASPQSTGRALNLGTGQECSIGDLADKILERVGRPVRIVDDPARFRPENSEVERLLADNRKARELVGWAPEHSLEQGLDLTVQWIEKNIDHYKTDSYIT